jgi:hypothetical protein
MAFKSFYPLNPQVGEAPIDVDAVQSSELSGFVVLPHAAEVRE